MKFRAFVLWGLIATALFAFMPNATEDGQEMNRQDWADYLGAANAPCLAVSPLAVEASDMGPILGLVDTNAIYSHQDPTEADHGKEVTAPVPLLHQALTSANYVHDLSGNADCDTSRFRTSLLSLNT